jgi:membrane-associated protein
MDLIVAQFTQLVDLFLHLDRHLDEIVRSAGIWSYALLFAVVFCETGLVVTPFLPGDSLLFAVGAIAALGSLELELIYPLLCLAAVLGDTVNYWIGARVGPRVFHYEGSAFFKREHLERTHRFYERHGGKTIIIARFVPIIRTFAPFVAGIGTMSYRRFFAYNVVGGVLWVTLFLGGGYAFGNLEVVRRHFTLVVVAIIGLSVLPILVEFVRQRRSKPA